MSVPFVGRIAGRTVLDAEGKVVGTVDDVLIDPTAWRVDGFRMRLKREVARSVGASPGLLSPATIEIPTRMVSAVGDAVILSVSSAALQELTAAEPSSTAEGGAGQAHRD